MLMNNITFVQITTEKAVERVVKLADKIWREHYIPIIGKAQVDYMLNKFQSKTAIMEQIKNGCLYYLIKQEGKPEAGYISFKPGRKEFFLSKFYILATCRGIGYGRQAIEFMKLTAAKAGAGRITVSVNKNNLNSILAYKKLGFKITKNTTLVIGSGFIMDDYRMKLALQRNRPSRAATKPRNN